MDKRVFIIHSHEDHAFVARLIEALMSSGDGFTIYRTDNLAAGDDLVSYVARAIKSSSAVIYVSSENSQKSNWTQTELAIALANDGDNLSIIPIVISGSSVLPPLIRNRLFIDFRNEDQFKRSIQRLRAAILFRSGVRSSSEYDQKEITYILKKAGTELKKRDLTKAAADSKQRNVLARRVFATSFYATFVTLTGVTAGYLSKAYKLDELLAGYTSLIALISLVLGFYAGRILYKPISKPNEGKVGESSHDGR